MPSGCPRPATLSPTLPSRSDGLQRARRLVGKQRFRELFRRGSQLNLDQAVAFALGARTDADAPSLAPVEPSPLTRRELEVADLVAEGLSNPEIAARLVISVRTAQGHVENILRKLGFNSRSRIAAWVTERRLAAEATCGTRAARVGRRTARGNPRHAGDRVAGPDQARRLASHHSAAAAACSARQRSSKAFISTPSSSNTMAVGTSSPSQNLLGTRGDVPPEGRSLVATLEKTRSELEAPVVDLVPSLAPHPDTPHARVRWTSSVRAPLSSEGRSCFLPAVAVAWTARVAEDRAGNIRRSTGSVACSRRVSVTAAHRARCDVVRTRLGARAGLAVGRISEAGNRTRRSAGVGSALPGDPRRRDPLRSSRYRG